MTKPRLILISGIPGTGKTSTANYLATHHGYKHFDREQFATWPRFLRTLWIRSLSLFVKFVAMRYGRVVISWGFLPQMDNVEIRRLIEQGFVMAWFDGEREVARREFLKRGTATDEEFDAQVSRIEQLQLVTFPHTQINPFGLNRQFKPHEEIVRQVLKTVL